MRSAQIPFGTWAIMKKLSKLLFFDEVSISINYEQNMNTL